MHSINCIPITSYQNTTAKHVNNSLLCSLHRVFAVSLADKDGQFALGLDNQLKVARVKLGQRGMVYNIFICLNGTF